MLKASYDAEPFKGFYPPYRAQFEAAGLECRGVLKIECQYREGWVTPAVSLWDVFPVGSQEPIYRGSYDDIGKVLVGFAAGLAVGKACSCARP